MYVAYTIASDLYFFSSSLFPPALSSVLNNYLKYVQLSY